MRVSEVVHRIWEGAVSVGGVSSVVRLWSGRTRIVALGLRLRSPASGVVVETVRGVGYRLKEER
jgi:hypothetical protein